jgi:hypothetical protein
MEMEQIAIITILSFIFLAEIVGVLNIVRLNRVLRDRTGPIYQGPGTLPKDNNLHEQPLRDKLDGRVLPIKKFSAQDLWERENGTNRS